MSELLTSNQCVSADDVQVSDDGRVITMFGIRYDVELFRHLGVGPIGSRIELVSREDGMVTLKRLPDETSVPTNPRITDDQLSLLVECRKGDETPTLAALIELQERRRETSCSDGYKDAFYQIAELLGLTTAMPISPKAAFKTVMLPRLRELVAVKTSREPGPLCPKCKTELAFPDDICWECNPVAAP